MLTIVIVIQKNKYEFAGKQIGIVHLSDENNSKEGINDKKCLLEARLEGRQPIAVTALGNTYDLAVNGATDKLKSSLDTIVGKMRSNHRG